jgi:hypothetical protein
MKKLVIVSAMLAGLSTPSYAWYDSYGGFTCGYLDPLTSFLDSIFGPPCPPPVPVAAPVPVAPVAAAVGTAVVPVGPPGVGMPPESSIPGRRPYSYVTGSGQVYGTPLPAPRIATTPLPVPCGNYGGCYPSYPAY